MMTVTDLINELAAIPDPDNTIIVQSIDSEGNSIRVTSEFSDGDLFELGPSRWDGELKLAGELTPDLEAIGYEASDMGSKDDSPCICFWPVN